jgi:4'-phosphopantetheinyl transferase
LEVLLSEEEKQRAEQFRFPQHRQAFVVRRGILRILLSQYTDIAPMQIEFKYMLTGKPHLANQEDFSDIHFNLSHSELLGLYAFSWGRQVGIDVECVRSMHELEQVARQNFSAEEYGRFKRLGRATKLKAFYHCWTRKEAFIKATGDGLYFPLHEFEVSFEPYYPAELLSVAGSRERAKRWSMHDIKTCEGYAAALVVDGNDYAISHKQWTFPSLLFKA